MTSNPPKSFPYRSKPAAYATKKQLIAVNLRIDRANDKLRDLKMQLESLGSKVSRRAGVKSDDVDE